MWKMEKLYYSVSYYPTLVPYYPTLVPYYPTLVTFVVLIARYKNGKYFLRNKFINRKPKIIRVNVENGKIILFGVLLSDACALLSDDFVLLTDDFVLLTNACVFRRANCKI